jgi:hypothetical protein
MQYTGNPNAAYALCYGIYSAQAYLSYGKPHDKNSLELGPQAFERMLRDKTPIYQAYVQGTLLALTPEQKADVRLTFSSYLAMFKLHP